MSFLGTLSRVDLSDDVYGVFAEASLPILDSVQAQLAYRYEDYGGKVGSTSNPKLSVRWQAFLTYDLVYRLTLPSQTVVTASVFNLTDRDPPFARLDYSYDPFIANPVGRSFKVGVAKRF